MSEAPLSEFTPRSSRPEQARLGRFFATIAKHHKALDLAIEANFGGHLDPVEWRRAFESAEPHDANRTMVVTGDHSVISTPRWRPSRRAPVPA